MRKRWTAWALLVVAAFCHEQRAWAAEISEFVDFSLRTSRQTVPGRLYVPPEAAADPTRPRPLMVFLHGAGAVGDNNATPVQQTPDYMLEEAKRRRAFLYVPQTGSSWAATTILDGVMTMTDRVVAEMNADTDRLYLIGSSLGGGGVWNLLSRHSGRFSAALSAAGISPAGGFTPANLLGTAIMAVHARDDGVVSVNNSRTVIRNILTAAGEPPPAYPPLSSEGHWALSNPALATHRAIVGAAPPEMDVTNVFTSQPDLDLLYFELPKGGHSVSAGAFYHPLIYEWMFSHGAPVPEPNALGSMAAAALCVRGAARRVQCRAEER